MSYTNLLFHIIIRTKNSAYVLENKHSEKLYRYIWGFVRQKNCVLHRINGTPNHIHLLVSMHPTIAVSNFVKELKTSAHAWLKNHVGEFPAFEAWGSQYAAFSCGLDAKERITKYIAEQREHHATVDFESEYKKILEENGIKPDMAYWLRD